MRGGNLFIPVCPRGGGCGIEGGCGKEGVSAQGVSADTPTGKETSPPPTHTHVSSSPPPPPPTRWLVRILLECILVISNFPKTRVSVAPQIGGLFLIAPAASNYNNVRVFLSALLASRLFKH